MLVLCCAATRTLSPSSSSSWRSWCLDKYQMLDDIDNQLEWLLLSLLTSSSLYMSKSGSSPALSFPLMATPHLSSSTPPRWGVASRDQLCRVSEPWQNEYLY